MRLRFSCIYNLFFLLIEFDLAEDAKNRANHRIGLSEYAAMDLAAAIAVDSPHQGEARTVLVGPIAGRLHVAVITYRGTVTRVISLRKANPREERLDVQATRA